MTRVSVLMGGPSTERDVSLASGHNCADALREAGYDVQAIMVGQDIRAVIDFLTEQKPDVVFNALHGRYGEDGNIQGVLNFLKIPYTHSGLMASAIAMDKPMAKRLFAAAGLQCPDGVIVERAAILQGDVMARPYVVKPVNEGSSVGVRIVQTGDNKNPFAGTDWPFGETVLVERFIPGRELTVGVMGGKTGVRAMAVTELRPREGFYDYASKYTDGKTIHLCPAPLPEAVATQAMRMAVKAHEALGCRGITRSDLRYDDTAGGGPNKLYLLEINTQPGMTSLSLVPEQARHLGMSYAALVSWMVENAAWDS